MDRMLMTANEVAATLRLSRSKVYQMLSSGDLPTVRIGRSVRVPGAALHAWIAGRTRLTADE